MMSFLRLPFEILVFSLKLIAILIESIINSLTAKERDVTDDIVLITGSGSGIGRELAIQYANLGSKVVCWDIDEENNLETVRQIKSKGQQAAGFTYEKIIR